jgi:hypothetical protein
MVPAQLHKLESRKMYSSSSIERIAKEFMNSDYKDTQAAFITRHQGEHQCGYGDYCPSKPKPQPQPKPESKESSVVTIVKKFFPFPSQTDPVNDLCDQVEKSNIE